MALFLLALSSIFGYLLSLTPLVNFLPQIVAAAFIIIVVLQRKKIPTIHILSFTINFIVFSQNGVQSPLFFLIYFLLFIVAFQYNPHTSLSFSLITNIFLAHTINSPMSLIPVISILFISPIVWFISRQSQINKKDGQIIAFEETDMLLWLNLKFKTGISSIIDSTSQLQSTPLSYSQKVHLKKIKDSAKSLLNSSQKLSKEISDEE